MAGNAGPYVILGAGCAGLTLCCDLLEAGVTENIVLLDRRTSFTDDRTWCFWNVRPHPFLPLVTHCWHSWRLFSPEGEEIRHTGAAIGYARLRAYDFYDAALERIARASNVSLRMGESVEGLTEDADGVRVRTDHGDLRAAQVFDGRGGAPTSGGLRQHFLGQFIQTSAPAFDPSCPTLMDFRVGQEAGVRFFYVLPLSPTEALVEHTCLGGPARAPEAHRAAIADYARRFHGLEQFQVTQEEAGSIPMRAERIPLRRGRRVWPIGQAGGASKPSSGYTFLRIQEQCRLLAAAVAAGTLGSDAPRRFAPRRFAFYDAAFLAVFNRHPERFPAYFCRLFRRVGPDALARFLSETSTWSDEWQVAAALPPGPFLQAACVAAPQWLPHLLP